MSEFKKQVIAALLGAIAAAFVGALGASLIKVYHPDAMIKIFNGVTQTQYKLLEDRVAAVEGRLPGYENLERRVNSLLSGHTIIKVFNADSSGLLTSNGFSNPVVLSGGQKQSMGQQWKSSLYRSRLNKFAILCFAYQSSHKIRSGGVLDHPPKAFARICRRVIIASGSRNLLDSSRNNP
jgi:hypothetical protein